MGRIRIRKAVEMDYSQIISIQNAISDNSQEKFAKIILSINMDISDINNNEDYEIWTAIIDLEVVGFTYIWKVKSLPKSGIFKSIIESVPEQFYNGSHLEEFNTFIYSPIFLRKNWQKGVRKKLFEKIIEGLKYNHNTDLIMVHLEDHIFINESIRRLDMKELGSVFYHKGGFNLVCFKMECS